MVSSFSCRVLSTLAVSVLLSVLAARANGDDYSYTTFDVPGATGGTSIRGISGSALLGEFTDSTGTHGFIYDGALTKLDAPGSSMTMVFGISNSTIVGFFRSAGVDHGFTLTGGVYSTLDFPGSSSTWVLGISGDSIIGNHFNSGGTHGFIYDEGVFTQLDYPGAAGSTGIYGISGTTVVGSYSSSRGFTYDGGVYSGPINFPGAGNTLALGIDGSTLVGDYNDPGPWPFLGVGAHAFIRMGGVYTTLDFPGATATRAYAVSGQTVVGGYLDASGITHGFIATPIPEPASLAVLGSATATLLIRRRRK